MKRLVIVLFALVSLCLTLPGHPAGAWNVYPDWQAGEPDLRVSGDTVTRADADGAGSDCTTELVSVRDYPPTEACVTQMKGWRYALYDHLYQQYGLNMSQQFFVVGIGADSKMYVVNGMTSTVEPLNNPGSDTLVYHDCCAYGGSDIRVFRHFLNYITRDGEDYRYTGVPPAEAAYYGGAPIIARAAAVSHGGDWLVAETGAGIVRVDLATGEARNLAPITTDYSTGYGSKMALAVSDDGQTVFVGGQLYAGRQFWEVSVTDSCGTRDPADLSVQRGCPQRDLAGFFNSGALPDGWPVGFRLSPHGKRLDFYVQKADWSYIRVSLYPNGEEPAALHYLALGDSFSSGEGDPGNYEAHTDEPGSAGVPREMCHLSRHAYPFDLAGLADVNAPVQSVACNNAHIADVASDDPNAYQGQDGRLSGLSTATQTDLRASAMDGFIPGRVRQNDFVNEYQPRAITIGIGGNDVQFARIIGDCARSVLTCSYASDPTDRRNLGDSIGGLYPKLVALYAAVARDDPGARIFAVGYPRFVNAAADTCPATVNLDPAERRTIDQGVLYINGVIEAAAATAGVGYADVGDALIGHRLCDAASDDVNGIDFGDLQAQETFHPTPAGHAAMARAIRAQFGTADLAAVNYCPSGTYPCPSPTGPPSLPAFFGDASVRPTDIALPSELILGTGSELPYVLTKGVEFVIQASLLAAGSTVHMELHSATLDLGNAMVGADGTLSAKLTLPDSVETGYHTLYLYGASPSGESVDMYEIVYVKDATAPEQPGAAVSSSAVSSFGGDPYSSSKTAAPGCSAHCQSSTPSLSPIFTDIAVLPDTVGHLLVPGLIQAIVLAAIGLAAFARRLLRHPRPN